MSDQEDIFQSDSNNSGPVIDPEKDYFSEFVGEGKKYKDAKAAGRALIEKDLFIEQLKREAEEARQEARSRISVEEALTKISSNRAEPVNNGQGHQPPSDGNGAVNQPGGGNNVDIEKLVEEKLAAHERDIQQKTQRQKEEENLNTVQQKLQEIYGPNYAAKVKEEAEKLGVSTQFLTETGRREPKALFKLLDLDTQRGYRDITDPAPASSRVNTAGMTNSGSSDRTMSYYERLRKSDPKRYLSQEIQVQKHKDALRLGQAFFDV